MSNCKDCEERDNENNCCPKYCEVIRATVKENEEYYLEHILDIRKSVVRLMFQNSDNKEHQWWDYALKNVVNIIDEHISDIVD